MAAEAAAFGLDLRLGFELTPSPALLEEDPGRYRLGGLGAVLMELPFRGDLSTALALAENIERAGLTPIIAHPERAEAVLGSPACAHTLSERGWPLQVNATSLLGYHGRPEETLAWLLLEQGLAEVVASDGHRAERPPFLDQVFAIVRGRLGAGAIALFDGTAIPRIAKNPAEISLPEAGKGP